jgi:hypothetical protein
MEHQLKAVYSRWGAAIAVLWTAWRIARHFADITLPSLSLPVPWGPIVFILAVASGLAGPILYRTAVALIWREKTSITPRMFERFERHLILLGMASLTLAMGADVLAVPLFYQAGTLSTALYAVYSTFPSQKRLALDRRLFRVVSGSGSRRLRVIPNSFENR